MSLPRPRREDTHFHGHHARRRGAAAVEFAVAAPLLLLFVLGIIDVGQFINVGQTVSNASRKGARLAARSTTLNASQVDASVASYMTDIYPYIPASAVKVTVLDGSGAAVPAGDLTKTATGSPISVQVVLQYDPVRWLSGLIQLNSRTIATTTVTRRE